MKRVALFKVFVTEQETALRFYVDRLGFEVAEDKYLGDYHWLLIRAPGNKDICLNLETARTDEERALVGRQAAQQPLFSINTDDCLRDYAGLKDLGVAFDGEPEVMPFGTGAMMRDLYGNRIYLSQEAE